MSRKLLSKINYNFIILFLLTSAIHWTVFPPHKFTGWNCNPQYAGIWRWGLWDIIRFRWGQEGGGLLIWLVPWEEEEEIPKHLRLSVCLSISLSISQEEVPHQEWNLPAPWSWTWQPLKSEILNVCLSYTVCGVWLQQPERTSLLPGLKKTNGMVIVQSSRKDSLSIFGPLLILFYFLFEDGNPLETSASTDIF